MKVGQKCRALYVQTYVNVLLLPATGIGHKTLFPIEMLSGS